MLTAKIVINIVHAVTFMCPEIKTKIREFVHIYGVIKIVKHKCVREEP